MLMPWQNHPYIWAFMGMTLGGIVGADLEKQQIPSLYVSSLLIITLVGFMDDSKAWLSGALLMALFVSLHVYYLWHQKKVIVGMGDIKLLSILGFWIPLEHLPLFLGGLGALGMIFGFLWTKGKSHEPFPFAPPIVAMFFILWAFGCLRHP